MIACVLMMAAQTACHAGDRNSNGLHAPGQEHGPRTRQPSPTFFRNPAAFVETFVECSLDQQCDFYYFHVAKTGGTTIEGKTFELFPFELNMPSCCNVKMMRKFPPGFVCVSSPPSISCALPSRPNSLLFRVPSPSHCLLPPTRLSPLLRRISSPISLSLERGSFLRITKLGMCGRGWVQVGEGARLR